MDDTRSDAGIAWANEKGGSIIPITLRWNADRALAKGRLDVYRFWREVMGALRDMGRRLAVDGERLN